jgi:quinol monooxygenase YgiN
MSDTNQEVRVFAEAQALPGHEHALRELFLDVLAPTRQEMGCRSYHLHEDVDQPGHFFFYETWASLAALEAHRQQPHLRHLGEASKHLLAHPTRVTVVTMLA